MSDKIIFLKKIKSKQFHKILSSEIELPSFNNWLNLIKDSKDASEYILSNDFNYLLLYRPLNKNKNLLSAIKQKLNKTGNDWDIIIEDDIDYTYEDESVYDATYGLNSSWKIIFEKPHFSFKEFLLKRTFFRLNNYDWYYKDDGNMNDDNLVYPEIEDLKDWSYKNEKLYIKEIEQLRFLSFKFLIEKDALAGFEFYNGSSDLVNSLIWNTENYNDKSNQRCRIYAILNSSDEILIKDDSNIDTLEKLIKISGTKSW